jgi:hypothetical protein
MDARVDPRRSGGLPAHDESKIGAFDLRRERRRMGV